jgi:hypothetical protein
MVSGDRTTGRRVDSYEEFFDASIEEGVYWKVTVDGVTCWQIRPPGCDDNGLLGPQPPASGHDVDEHDDGTITVEPKPGNSNSILCPLCRWHGYIERGVWVQV